MMTFLVWWTVAAMVLGSAATAWLMHMTFRAH